MEKLHYLQAGVFHLKRMETLYRRKYKTKHSLSDENEVLRLVEKVSLSSDAEIKRELIKFIENTQPKTKKKLEHHIKTIINSQLNKAS